MTIDQNTSIVHCPKCGYAQDERLDCMKCGIVFNKYYALHNAGRTSSPESSEPSLPRIAEEIAGHDLNDLRQNSIELQRLGNTIEFERLERTRINGEIKVLERELHERCDSMGARLAELERPAKVELVPPLAVAPNDLAEFKRDLVEIHFEPLVRRLEEVEQRLDAAPRESLAKTDPRVLDILRRFEVRVAELEARAARFSSEEDNGRDLNARLEKSLGEAIQHWAELREAVLHLQGSLASGMSRTDAICAELDATVRSEAENIANMEREQARFAEELKRLDLQWQSDSANCASIIEPMRDLPARTSLLAEKFDLLQAECLKGHSEITQLREKMEELPALPAEEPRPFLDAEVHAIRANFDLLLRQIGALAQKP